MKLRGLFERSTDGERLIGYDRGITHLRSGQGVARPQTEIGPASEVAIATAQLEAVFDRDSREMRVGHEPHGGLCLQQRIDELEVPGPRFRDPCRGP